eukprot:COSAG01_NODE_8803_length_2654_cov_6.132681_3_plen_98_part_00
MINDTPSAVVVRLEGERAQSSSVQAGGTLRLPLYGAQLLGGGGGGGAAGAPKEGLWVGKARVTVPSPRHNDHGHHSGLAEFYLGLAIPILILMARSR